MAQHGLAKVLMPSMQGRMSRRPFTTSTNGTGLQQCNQNPATTQFSTRLWRGLTYMHGATPQGAFSPYWSPQSKSTTAFHQGLSNCQIGGALGMHVKHVKVWLRGVVEEEDPEGSGNKWKGDNWNLFVLLMQAIWTRGSIPHQLLWI